MVGKLFLAVGLGGSQVVVEASSNIKAVFVEHGEAGDIDLNLPSDLEPGLYRVDVDVTRIENDIDNDDDDWDIKVLEVRPVSVDWKA